MKTKNTFKQNIFIVFVISFLLFMVTSGLGTVVEDVVNQKSFENSDTTITDWRFVWSNDVESLENVGKWKVSSSKVPVKKEAGKKYVRFNYTLGPSDTTRILHIATNNAPVKVLINNEEVYNNGFGKTSYVGNKTNNIEVPQSSAEQDVDIYMRSALSFQFSADLADFSEYYSSVNSMSYLKVVAPCVFLIVGIALSVITLILSVNKRNTAPMLLLGISIILESCRALGNSLMYVNDSLSPSIILRLLFGLRMMVCVTLFAAITMLLKNNRDKFLIAGFSGMSAAAVLLVAVGNLIFIKIIFALYCLAAIATAARIIMLFIKNAKAGNRFGFISIGLVIYFTLTFVYNLMGVFLFRSKVSEAAEALAVIVFCIAVFIVTMNNILMINIRRIEREKQIEKDTQWITKIISSASNVYSKVDLVGFLSEVGRDISQIIEGEKSFEDKEDYVKTPIQDYTVKYCIAVKDEDSFEEVYNSGDIEKCDYQQIFEKYENDSSNEIFFAGTYLDLVFAGSNKTAIIHFQNVLNGFSDNIKNIISVAFSNFNKAMENINMKRDMYEVQKKVFINLAEIVENKSEMTSNHLNSVSDMTRVLAQNMKLPPEDVVLIAEASRVHDIGKIAVSDSIVTKRGKLSDEDFEEMKMHVAYGYNILSKNQSKFMECAAVIAHEHHEKYDGSGYLGMKGDEIDISAKIVAVSDVFDALLSNRTYKKAWPYETVYEYIVSRSGTEFDPEVIKVFKSCAPKLYEIKQRYM